MSSNSDIPESQVMGLRTPSSLINYLSHIRHLALRRSRTTASSSEITSTQGKHHPPAHVVLVSGNPSADLDSFISAIVLSYFYNRKQFISKHDHDRDRENHDPGRGAGKSKVYIPMLNLASVPSSDLWRLRPEYGVAVQGAVSNSEQDARTDLTASRTDSRSSTQEGFTNSDNDGTKKLLSNVLTLNDITASNDSDMTDAGSQIRAAFTSSNENSNQNKLSVILTDHNNPAFATTDLSARQISARLEILGCIDHHVDEDVVPKDAQPRLITMHAGSCTSLVVKHLREAGLWPSASKSVSSGGSDSARTANESENALPQDSEETQTLLSISTLALAPILIDTNKLQSKGDKCTDVDRDAVSFLEGEIKALSNTIGIASVKAYDRDEYKDSIYKAKSESLNLLTMQEIWARDYKLFTESITSTSTAQSPATNKEQDIRIGMSTLVRPVSWLMQHAANDDKAHDDQADRFVSELISYATKDQKLDVFALMTASAVETGQFRRELGIFVVNKQDPGSEHVVQKFEKKASELQLRKWDGALSSDDKSGDKQEATKSLLETLERKSGSRGTKWQIWDIGDLSKTRKQVAPLLRSVVNGEQGN